MPPTMGSSSSKEIKLSLSALLKAYPASTDKKENEKQLEPLQRKFLRIQQGIWHRKCRAILVFEGFDSAGKGGAIRRLVECLDPRGYQVHPIAMPKPEDQEKHYLYRFWKRLPAPGTIAIFDRSWYGRVLVERVKNLTKEDRWKSAYQEIVEFEQLLINDGIELVKIFLAIDKGEQLSRFEERLQDPYKQWKLTMDDVEARTQWDQYVSAVDDMFEKTDRPRLSWHLIAANEKHFARVESLRVVTENLNGHAAWMEDTAYVKKRCTLERALKNLGLKKQSFQ